ncbi:hypothetical protein FNF29_04830 [Cafeteria roenbergensis]|uniref:Major facilitator superfamily (MFS) profile domain-containing protein n=2 Tax=Cafeteria roenbergensis TaxID=33653 RepID=A0A5A8CE09_CAFRO|nr:hypothetical protein FNF29_04830 [Cafeteria roenbergensis]|eukprot:KAA0151138.1 hypothetical protein FNF29_04830 [Cafeteria roenbergensis]
MGSVVDAWIGLAAVVAHAEACRRAALVIGKSLRQSGAGSDGWARQSGNLIKLTRGVPLAVAALAWHMSTSPERESQIRASVSLFSVVVAFACGLAAVPARQSTGRRATQYFASLVAMAALHFLWAVTLRTVVALYAPRGATGMSGRHAGLLLACAANAAASAAISPVVKACSSAALAPPAEQRLPRAPHPTPKRGVPPGWSARARPNAGIAAADGFALRQATLGPGLPTALMQARAVLPRDASSSPAGLLDVSLASALAPPLAEADRDAAMERVALKLGRRAEVNLQSLRVIAPEGARRGGADPMRTAVGLPDCWSDLVTIAHWAIQDSAGLHRLSLAALSYLAPVEQSVVPEGLLLDSEGQALPDGMPASQQQADAVSRLMALPVVPRAAKVCGEPSGLRYAREGRAGRAASPADAGAVAVAAASRAGWEAGLAPYVLASPDTRTNPLGTLVVVGGNRAELEGAPGVWDRDVCSTAGMRDGSVLELCRVRWLSRLTRLCKEDAAAAAERAAGRAEAPFLAAALQESAAHIRSGTPGPLGSRNLSTVEEEAIGSGSSEQGLSAAAELQSASAGLGFTSALLDAASSPGSLATSAHPCLQHLLRVWDDLLSRGLPGRPLVWLARGDAAAFVIEALRRREQALAATTLVIVTEPDARGMAAVQTVLAGDSPFSRRLLDGRMLVFERVHPWRPASGAGIHAPVGSWEREGTFASAVDPAAFSFASVDVDRDSAERGESASSADEAGVRGGGPAFAKLPTEEHGGSESDGDFPDARDLGISGSRAEGARDRAGAGEDRLAPLEIETRDDASCKEHLPEGDGAAGGKTPFPLAKVVVISGVVASNTVSLMLLVPAVPFMVQRFLPHLKPEEIGYASGALEGVFHVGQLFGAILWGALADVWGRRPVMLAGLLGTVVSCLLFGLAESYPVALVARLLWGLLNANVGVSKTMLAEVSGPQHNTRAFAALGVVGALGRLVGPSAGGILAMPAENIGGAFDSYAWRRWPLLLPCLVAAAITLLTGVAVWGMLEETLPRTAGGAQPVPATPSSSCPDSTDLGVLAGEDGAASIATAAGGEGGSGSDEEAALELTTSPAAGAAAPAVSAAPEAPADGAGEPKEATASRCLPGAWRGLLTRQVLLSTGLYGAISFVGLAAQECLPLLLLGDAAHGGLDMGSTDIGATIAAVGPALLLFQVFAYPRIVAAAGLMPTIRACTVLYAICLALTPVVTAVSGGQPVARWTAAIGLNIATTLARVPIFISTFVLIAEASPTPNLRASVNGLGQSVCAVGRIAGPPLLTSLLAWSTSLAAAWPLNFHLAWDAMALCVLFGVAPIVWAIRARGT